MSVDLPTPGDPLSKNASPAGASRCIHCGAEFGELPLPVDHTVADVEYGCRHGPGPTGTGAVRGTALHGDRKVKRMCMPSSPSAGPGPIVMTGRPAASGTTQIRRVAATAEWDAEEANWSAVGCPAPLVGAVGRTCDVHHRTDVAQRDAVRVQIGVDVVCDLLWRPTPPEIVADEVCHPDERLVVARRPSNADAAQLSGGRPFGSAAALAALVIRAAPTIRGR